MKRLLFAGLLAVLGCGGRHPARDAAVVDVTDVRPFAPVTPGDRWRVRVMPTGRFDHYGVTAVDARGRAVILGTDRAALELVESTAEGVYLVTPEGERLAPVIVRPLRVGASTAYTVNQGPSAGRCELRVLATDVHADVADVAFGGCVQQRRVCHLPAGGGLPRPTTVTDEETRCPGVGLVRDVLRVEPPLPFDRLPSHRESTLVGYHVRGAPVVPRTLALSDRLIVLPSDVSAVCGGTAGPAELRAVATTAVADGILGLSAPTDARASDTLLAFALRDGNLLVEARSDAAAGLDAYVGPRAVVLGSVHGSEGPPRRIGFDESGALVRITAPQSCASTIARLEPVIRSMLR